MKRNVRILLDKILRLFGITTIRTYELDYLKEKFGESVTELTGLLAYLFKQPLPPNKRRNSLLMKLFGTSVSEALYILNFLHKCLRLQGDICEFGIANGATSVLIANEIKNSNKKLWLFDSFLGLSKPDKEDKMLDDIFKLGKIEKYEGTMKYPEEEVISKLKQISFPNKRFAIVKGFVENSLKQKTLPKKVCFAYIDFDLYKPTIDTLLFLHDHLSPKSYIIVDDYNFFSLGVKTAVDEFIKSFKKKYKLIMPLKFAGNFCIIYRTF